MNRRELFRLAGAVAVAPRAMLAAPVVTPCGDTIGRGLDSGIALREYGRHMEHRSAMARLHYLAQLQGMGIIATFSEVECDSV